MQTSPAPWIETLRQSHDRLRATVEPLDVGQLKGPSYAKDWSIAQVLSHLGSGAEIFGLFLEAGLTGQDPPGQGAFPPIWAAWNDKSPQDQATDGLRADGALVERLESMDAEQLARLRLALFGMDLDTAALARLRLGEHAVHSWDVAVALDPSATVAADAVGLLIDTVDQLVARAGKPAGDHTRLHVLVTDPTRHFTLDVGDKVTLAPSQDDDSPPDLRLPAEAFIRLVYGRLDPAHTPPIETGEPALDQLRPVFPGF